MAVKQTSEEALAQLRSHANEPVKQFVVYDIAGRTSIVYTTHFLAKDGFPCYVTHYEYDGSTTRVIKRNEFIGEWDSATMNSANVDVPDELKG